MIHHQIVRCGLIYCAVLAIAAMASSSAPAAAQAPTPTTESAVATTEPATKPARISAAARAELERIAQAYHQIKSAEMDGTGSIEIVMQDPSKGHKGEAGFSSFYEAPNKFYHYVKDNRLIGSDGQTMYNYALKAKTYVTATAPQEHIPADKMPHKIFGDLAPQNTSLTVALVSDPITILTFGATDVDMTADTQINGKAYPTLQVLTPAGNESIAIDPDTHLIRRLTVDYKESFERRGLKGLKKALMVTDYTKVDLHPTLKADQFAWTPPADATQELSVLDWKGKTPPDFTLTSLDGKQVTLSDLKGKVVMLDFWATWCPPCLQALPHLTKMYEDLKDQGFQLYAIDIGEAKEPVTKMLEKLKINPPVLLDSNSKVIDAYHVTIQPSTLIIGRDGVVREVFTGIGPDISRQERAAVEAALKE